LRCFFVIVLPPRAVPRTPAGRPPPAQSAWTAATAISLATTRPAALWLE
jgi:hypothetical protein